MAWLLSRGGGGPAARRERSVAVATAATCAAWLVTALALAGPAAYTSRGDVPSQAGLTPTVHDPVPALWTDLWLVPEAGFDPPRASVALAEGYRLLAAQDARGALARANEAAAGSSPSVTGYAHLLAGQALQQVQRFDEARGRLDAARAAGGNGALYERASRVLADVELQAGQPARAVQILEELLGRTLTAPDAVLAGLVRAATAAGDGARATAAALRLYYEHATSPAADAEPVPSLVTAARAAADAITLEGLDGREVQRGDQLFTARRYADARVAFERARPTRRGAPRALVDLRIAQCDYHLKRHRAAVDRLLPLVEQGPHAAEAAYHLALASRALGQRDRYLAVVERMTTRFRGSPWTAEALNNLASYFLVASDTDRALETFDRLLREYPEHRHAERAAWRLGWARYRAGRFEAAAAIFEQGARHAPRSDYRPAWLYWSGRAHEQAGDLGRAIERYRVTVADYRHSYYGRLAEGALGRLASLAGRAAAGPALTPPAGPGAVGGASSGNLGSAGRAATPPNAELVRTLLAVGLLDLAEAEVRFAERAWGSSPALLATQAWIHHRRGELRRGITLMRRAYPQFLTAAGQQLPPALQQVIFPVDYWPLIQRYAAARNLDPFLVAALVAQESTFQPDARSVANALGLMQIIPATGRRLATLEGIRPFRVASLVNPEINVRLGTRYFADLLQGLGEVHLALASYNAGRSRVVRWVAERPGLPVDEFIDDIPFPETQNYVKRILGTVEDYRRLYGAGEPTGPVTRPPPGSAATPSPATATSPRGVASPAAASRAPASGSSARTRAATASGSRAKATKTKKKASTAKTTRKPASAPREATATGRAGKPAASAGGNKRSISFHIAPGRVAARALRGTAGGPRFNGDRPRASMPAIAAPPAAPALLGAAGWYPVVDVVIERPGRGGSLTPRPRHA